ncbi:hypothetical protein [Kocuria palustris]|uniref:hypothetical protein n=1 Tax=Kocuria palustris TaxID=71999 RepID=UPI00119E7D9B|nr:hypothetical protein [Kocuria palustris]
MPSTGRDGSDRPCREEADDGSAIVEFILLGAILLVPILIFVGVLAQAQAAAFAAVSAAQQGAQVLATQPAGEVTTAQVQAAAALPAADQGFDDGEVTVSVTCSDGACQKPGATATVTAAATVELPRIPFVGTVGIAEMEHSSTIVIGRYS